VTSVSSPAIIGAANGAEPVLVRVQVNVASLRRGQQAYVTGGGVASFLKRGFLVPVEAT
jgi:hypothetical protein